MVTDVFINLQVQDITKSTEFFKKLGFKINPDFSDETASSLVFSDHIYAMLQSAEKFKGFIKDRQPIDAHTSIQAINALGVSSKTEVDEIVDKAIAAGGKKFRETEDYGFMYLRSFEDLDGHVWEIACIDQSQLKK